MLFGQISNGRGCSSGVEHDLAKVGVEGSNPFARSNICFDLSQAVLQSGVPVEQGCVPKHN